MAWRNQQKQPNMSEGQNKFEKFFKKKNDNKDTTEGATIKFVNKKYDRDFSVEDTTEKKPYHPDDDHKVNTYHNNRRDGSYNNNRREGSYNNNRREGSYNNNRREGSYNNNRREGSYNNNRREGYYNNRRGNDYYDKKSSPIKQDPYNKLDLDILNMEKELNSQKYMSQKKKAELTEKLNKLKEDKKNEFPELGMVGTQNPVINSVWNRMPNNIRSTVGVKEANQHTKSLQNDKKIIDKVKKNEIYEEHVESDYNGDDFIDDSYNDEYYEDDL